MNREFGRGSGSEGLAGNEEALIVTPIRMVDACGRFVPPIELRVPAKRKEKDSVDKKDDKVGKKKVVDDIFEKLPSRFTRF